MTLYCLRIKIEHIRRQMYQAHKSGNYTQLLAASQKLDKLLNEYELAKIRAGLHYAG